MRIPYEVNGGNVLTVVNGSRLLHSELSPACGNEQKKKES
jgi:hypothetical protein